MGSPLFFRLFSDGTVAEFTQTEPSPCYTADGPWFKVTRFEHYPHAGKSDEEECLERIAVTLENLGPIMTAQLEALRSQTSLLHRIETNTSNP